MGFTQSATVTSGFSTAATVNVTNAPVLVWLRKS
jgi:hypothetical protein